MKYTGSFSKLKQKGYILNGLCWEKNINSVSSIKIWNQDRSIEISDWFSCSDAIFKCLQNIDWNNHKYLKIIYGPDVIPIVDYKNQMTYIGYEKNDLIQYDRYNSNHDILDYPEGYNRSFIIDKLTATRIHEMITDLKL